MTVFTNWQNSPDLNYLAPPYESCSPNLKALRDVCRYVWGGQYLGCHYNRDIRSGSKPSSHAYGAAFDWRYPDRKLATDVIIPFILWCSEEKGTGIQAIHDYYGDRIWRCNRDPEDYPDGWKKQNGAGTGMGETWADYFHVEVNKYMFEIDVDYGMLLKRYLGLEDTSVFLGDLEILDSPYRLWDSRVGRGIDEPYPANSTVTIQCKEGVKGVVANITPVGESNGGYISIWNPGTSAANWSKEGEVAPNCVPIKLNSSSQFNIETKFSCHIVVDVYAEG